MLAHQITLSWKPPTKSWLHVSTKISHIIHSGWLGILIKSYRDPSREYKSQRSFSPTTSEVVDIFEKLGPKVFEFLAGDIEDLYDWLSNKVYNVIRVRLLRLTRFIRRHHWLFVKGWSFESLR